MECPELRIEVARYVLGLSLSADLVRLADSLLEHGTYSPAADELASMPSPLYAAEVGPVFERLLGELDMPMPSRDEAVALLLPHYVDQVARGTVAPMEGIRHVDDVYDVAGVTLRPGDHIGAPYGLENLLGVLYSYQAYQAGAWPVSDPGPQVLDELDAEAVPRAREWMSAHCA